MADPKVKLIKFGGHFCAPCRAMDKKKLLENFVAKHPNITLEKINLDNPDQSPNEETSNLAAIYGVTTIPVIVFEDENKNELGREVLTSLGELEDLYKRSIARLTYKTTGKVEELDE